MTAPKKVIKKKAKPKAEEVTERSLDEILGALLSVKPKKTTKK